MTECPIYELEANHINKFVKHLIDAGIYPYPGNPVRDFVVDTGRLEGWVRAFHESDAKVWIPLRHSKDPKDNAGWVEDIFIEGGSLYAVMNITDPEVAEKIRQGSIVHTSLGLEFDFTDDSGRIYPEIIRHIALTLDPHISKQKPFIELSRDREEVDMPPDPNPYAYYDEKEQKGYFPHHNDDGSVDASTLVDALRQIDSENIPEEAKMKAREHIYEHLMEVLSSISKDNTTLMERLSKLEMIGKESQKKSLIERLRCLVREGRITPVVERELAMAIERMDDIEMESMKGSVLNLVFDALSKLPPLVKTGVLTRYQSFNTPSISSDEREIMKKLGISEESYIKYSKKKE